MTTNHQLYVQYNTTVNLLTTAGKACFNLAIALASFIFTGLGGISLGIVEIDHMINSEKLIVATISGLLIIVFFVHAGHLCIKWVGSMNIKEINDRMNDL